VASSRSRSFVMMVGVLGEILGILATGLSTSCGDQRTCVRPDCGGLHARTRIYFRQREVRISACSLRIQAIISNLVFALSPRPPCGYSKREQKAGCLVCDALIPSVGRRRGGARSLRSAHRQFVRRAAGQLLRLWRPPWFMHRRRHLGPRASGRAFLRRLRRLAGLDRRILWRVDRHLQHHLAAVAEIGACARDGGGCGVVMDHVSLHDAWSDNGAAKAMFPGEQGLEVNPPAMSSAWERARQPRTSMVLLRVVPVST
jgi:hypothetical protein